MAETTGIYYPTLKRTRGAGIVKSWENKRDRGNIPDTFASKRNNAREAPSVLPAFSDSGTLGSPPRQVVVYLLGST